MSTTPATWPTIDPGRLIHLIRIQAQSMAPDPYGQPQEVWTDVVSAWAAIDPVRGIDLIRGGLETTQLFLTVTMHWRPGITADMRVATTDGDYYVIQSIEDPQRRHVLLILNCLLLREKQG